MTLLGPIATSSACTSTKPISPSTDNGTIDPWFTRADAFMKQTVTGQGLVRYDVARQQRARLDELVAGLAPLRRFDKPKEELAFYLNAYNLIVVQGVVHAWPVRSVRNIGGFFNRHRHSLNGKEYTLDAIENDLVRPRGDARIHAALVCGARSCPPLWRGLYRAKTLEEQLDRVTGAWVSDAKKNDARDGGLWISKIFQWYGKDFGLDPYRGVIDFLRKHAGEKTRLAVLLAKSPTPTIRYLRYDWALNAAPNANE